MVHFGPKMAKHGRIVNVPKWSKRIQMGPKWSSQVFLTIWDPFGPIWTLLDHFRQNDFFVPNGQRRILQRGFGAKYQLLFKPRARCAYGNVQFKSNREIHLLSFCRQFSFPEELQLQCPSRALFQLPLLQNKNRINFLNTQYQKRINFLQLSISNKNQL